MTELKRLNVHRIVETPEEADKLVKQGFAVVSKKSTSVEETPPEKPAKAK